MAGTKIRYCPGYKYQLREDWTYQTSIKGQAAKSEFIELDQDGLLTVKDGYAWDGPSGPSIDTADFMRGSLAHDALYQLMREGHLAESNREAADDLLRQICREDGMSWFRAWYVYRAVRAFASPCAHRQVEKDLFAP